MPGVALAAVVIGVAAAWFASAHDLTMLYADARSHLTIARRLVDGPNHTIVQLGTVWLPLPHLALLPFVWSRSLWHSGVAAIPVDVACLVIESLALFSLATTLTRSKRVAWIAVALLLTNPSILYLHTTALTEPVLFAALLGTVRDARSMGEHREAVLRWRDRALLRSSRGGDGAVALRRLGDGRRGNGLRARCRAVAMAPVALLDPHRALLRRRFR